MPTDRIHELAVKYDVEESEDLIKKIMLCESGGDPEVINENKSKDGTIWSTDFGLWQINDYWHDKTAEKLGLDIKKHEDSLEYGFVLFKKQGTKPWKASRFCWSK